MPTTKDLIVDHTRRCEPITRYVNYLNENEDSLEIVLDELKTYLESKHLHVYQIDELVACYPVYIEKLSGNQFYSLSDLVELQKPNIGVSKDFKIDGRVVGLDDIRIPDIHTTEHYIRAITKFVKKKIASGEIPDLESVLLDKSEKDEQPLQVVPQAELKPSQIPPKAEPQPFVKPIVPAPVVEPKAPQLPPSPYHVHPVILANELLNERLSQSECDYILKIGVVGSPGSGGTSLVLRHARDVFIEDTLFIAKPFDTAKDTRIVSMNTEALPGKRVKLFTFDDLHKRRFFDDNLAYEYRGLHAVIITFDVTNKESFDEVRDWLTDVVHDLRSYDSIMIVGCKTDLKDREVDEKTAHEFAQSCGLPYFETSAKLNHNVDAVFNEVIIGIHGAFERNDMPRVSIDIPHSELHNMLVRVRNNTLLTFSRFDIKIFNKHTKAMNPGKSTRDKICSQILSVFSEKVDTLLINAASTSGYGLTRIIEHSAGLIKIRDSLKIIQPSLIFDGFWNKQTYISQINQLLEKMADCANNLTLNSPIAQFHLELMRFKLIDYSCLETLEPYPTRLLKYISSCINGIQQTSRIKPTESAHVYLNLLHLISVEIKALHQDEESLSKQQRAILAKLEEHTKACSEIGEKALAQYPSDYTVANAINDVKHGNKLGGQPRLSNV